MIFKKLKNILSQNDTVLNEEELRYANEQYKKRVSDFEKKFNEETTELEGEVLNVYENQNQRKRRRIPISEDKHSKIIDALRVWDKKPDEFPVRVIKAWKAKKDACEECKDLADIAIDVTPLFIGNETDEVYRKSGGGIHDGCRCSVQFEMERK